MSQENVELTLLMMDAWNRRDVEAMIELWDPEGVFYPAFEMLEGRTYRSPAEERQYFEGLAEFSDERKGAGATPGRASRGPSSGQAARQVQAPGPAL